MTLKQGLSGNNSVTRKKAQAGIEKFLCKISKESRIQEPFLFSVERRGTQVWFPLLQLEQFTETLLLIVTWVFDSGFFTGVWNCPLAMLLVYIYETKAELLSLLILFPLGITLWHIARTDFLVHHFLPLTGKKCLFKPLLYISLKYQCLIPWLYSVFLSHPFRNILKCGLISWKQVICPLVIQCEGYPENFDCSPFYLSWWDRLEVSQMAIIPHISCLARKEWNLLCKFEGFLICCCNSTFFSFYKVKGILVKFLKVKAK